MLKNRIVWDIAVGGGLAVALVSIFLIDRLASGGPGGAGQRVVRKSGTLLGDHQIVEHIKALGSEERLEKLMVVRLAMKASFANAANVNDISLMWCWEPNIIMRFVETFPDANRKAQFDTIDRGGEASHNLLIRDLKSNCDLDRDLESRFDAEARRLIQQKDYKRLFNAELILEDKGAYSIFNQQLSLPLKPERAVQMRNLCFALSVSNLIPIRRHNFPIETGKEQVVRGKVCEQFTVRDPDGLRLQFYFDKDTHLLAKIGHMGHDPRNVGVGGKQVFWEHYFSDYRETEGIKQWRRAEVDNDGRRFASLTVTGVEFFDEMRPELRRPGR